VSVRIAQLLTVCLGVAAAGAAGAAELPRAKAVRVSAPPAIDGRVDEAVWGEVPPHDSFTQVEPAQGQAPTERTQFRLAYDDAHVYIAVDCFDSDPRGIVSRLTRRDRDIEADWVSVSIDSRNDRNSAFLFQLSAAGVQVDGQVFADTNVSLDWDAVWSGAVSVDDAGWHAEFAIPLTVLRFSGADLQTWGLQVHRNVSRKREQMMWSYDPEGGQTWGVSRFGYIEGLQGLKPRRTFELRPYVASTLVSDSDLGGGFLGLSPRTRHEGHMDVGIDAKVGLTSRLTLDLTVNPDFGQVEADQVVLNLSRFETFFPEKRPFFLEGIDIFSTTIQLFYPRRIGRPAVGFGVGQSVVDGGEDVSITGADGTLRLWTAAKVTGEVGDGVSLGVLGALVGSENVDVVDGMGDERRLELAPLRGYGVLRARYALGGGTFVGFTGTSVNRLGGTVYRARADHDAYVQALDVFYRSPGKRVTAQAQLAVSERVGGPSYHLPGGRACSEADAAMNPSCIPIARADGTRMGDGAVGAGLQFRSIYETRSRLLKLEYTGHTPEFDPNDVGFAPRFNLNEAKVIGGFMKKTPDDFTNFRGVFPFFVGSMAMDGTPQYWLVGADLEATFPSFVFTSPEQWISFPGGYDIYETFDGGRFETPPAWEGHWNVGTNPAKAVSFYGNVSWSLALGDETRSASADVGLRWQARSNVELALEPSAGVEHAVRFYDCFTDSGRACLVEDGARHYRFADLDSRFLSVTFRGTMTISPPLSIQGYAQYFVADGEFSDYRDIDTMGAHPEIHRDDLRPSTTTGDVDGDGVPDDGFETASLNVNVVLRWEPHPGSTIYAVYTRAQESPYATPRKLDQGPTQEIVLVKFVYFVE
jgi:hypothetical protein